MQPVEPDTTTDTTDASHPFGSASEEVQELLRRLLQAERENLHMRRGITDEDVARIVKGVIQ